jgi:hypothetical protein
MARGHFIWPNHIDRQVNRWCRDKGLGRWIAIVACFAFTGLCLRSGATWYHWISLPIVGLLLLFRGKSDSEKRGYDF